jgi:hypothetical protein
MDQTTTAAPHVPSSARAARKTSPEPTLRHAVEKHEEKKVRKNGMVVSTILFDPQRDSDLSALAFAWRTDRSALARKLINSGLSHYDVAEEVREAAERYKRSASVESDGVMDRHDDGADMSPVNPPATR